MQHTYVHTHAHICKKIRGVFMNNNNYKLESNTSHNEHIIHALNTFCESCVLHNENCLFPVSQVCNWQQNM